MEYAISLHDLSKTYIINERSAGLRAAMRGLIRRKKKEVKAVTSISLKIEPGEIVGFLGPNGAGKTTTLKMLSGLLHPTSGKGLVLGYEPHKREKAFLKQITLVTGQRNQLVWDIPAIDSFEVNQAVYEVDREQFKQTVDEYIEILELQELVRKPVRQLSLGERMKVEIAAALLHRPKVLFLDEPTLGLDVPMQRRIRRFIAEYNAKHGATVLLTSHYMADVQALCKRVIVIHHGEILFDGQLSDLVQQFTGYKEIVVEPKDRSTDLSRYGEIMSEDAGRISLRIPRAEVPEVSAKLLADVPMFDFTVEEPPIEDVIERVFAQGSDETSS